MFVRRFLFLVGLVALLSSVARGSAETTRSADADWVVREIGTLGGRTVAEAINDRGQVVGYSETARGREHAFLWQKGRMTDLGTLPGRPYSIAVAINERGQVVGWSQKRPLDESGEPERERPHAYLWQNGRMIDLGGTPGKPYSWAFDINERGQVIGRLQAEDLPSGEWGHRHAFLWEKGRITDLGTLGGPQSEANAINDRGEIVGWSDTVPRSVQWNSLHAFLWSDGQMRDLGTLRPGWGSEASAINNRGQVVGWSHVYDEGTSPHAFLWQDGQMLNLETLPGDSESSAEAINRRGQVIGESTEGDRSRSFLWERGKMTRLGFDVGETSHGKGGSALNDRGQIVGTTYRKSRSRPALWWNGRLSFLSTPPGMPNGSAHEINVDGQIIGSMWGPAGRREVVWTPRKGS